MGNFCRINKGTISIDNNQTVMVESDTEIKVVLRFLFEKMHYMKTEESRLRINDQLKEIFNEFNTPIDFDYKSNFAKQSSYDKHNFNSAISYYERLFSILNLESSCIFNVNSYFEISKTLVINYYVSLLMLDKSFLQKLKDLGLNIENEIPKEENRDPDFIKSFISNSKLYKFIDDIISMNDNYDKKFYFLITDTKLNINFQKFINKFVYMMLLKKTGYIRTCNLEIKKDIKERINNVLKERCSLNNGEENENYSEMLDYLYKNLNTITERSTIKKVSEKAKLNKIEFDQSNLIGSTGSIPKSGSILITNTKLNNVFRNNSFSKKFAHDKKISCILPSHFNLSNDKTINSTFYFGEIDTYNYKYSNIGTLMKHSKYNYRGTFRNGKKDGYGYLLNFQRNFSIYIGEFHEGLCHGYGVQFTFPKVPKNSFIKAEYCEGLFKNGYFYEGDYMSILEIKDNRIMIEKYKGNYYNLAYEFNQKIKRTMYKKILLEEKYEIEYYYYYKGEYKDNLENGKGICIKSFPELNYRYYYKGDFEKGKMHGEGIILFDGNSLVRRYEGVFKEDKFPCQYGRLHFSSGDVFDGFFDKDNRKNEVGCYIHNQISKDKIIQKDLPKFYETNEINEEEFNLMNNKFLTMNVSDIFFGEFYCDRKHGLGKYLFNIGLLVVGKYIDGEQNGKFETIRNKKNDKEFLEQKNDSDKYGDTDKIKKEKIYYLIENDEIIDKSENPFKD